MSREEAIRALRLERQQLIIPVSSEEEYDSLFRKMSPVFTPYWCCPGSPPELCLRAAFDDSAYCFRKRSDRQIVKGRFQNGSVAYIFADELPLYAAVYRKLPPDTREARTILELLEREGPLTVQLIKEFTGMLVKEITPVLHKLQAAFLVFEDQSDNEWDRAWYLFGQVFPEAKLESFSREKAMERLTLQFAFLHVRIDALMLRSFYRFSLKESRGLLEKLAVEGKLWFDGTGYLLFEDREQLEQIQKLPEKSVFVLNRNDFLVRSNEHILTERFPARKTEKLDVLYYLLIDGEFGGAVYGRFHNGPFEVEDIVAPGMQEREEEILAALYRVSDPVKSPVRCFNGTPINP